MTAPNSPHLVYAVPSIPFGDAHNVAESVRALTRALLTEGEGNVHAAVLAHVERAMLPVVLEHCGGNKAHAADVLGIDRRTLGTKMLRAGVVAAAGQPARKRGKS